MLELPEKLKILGHDYKLIYPFDFKGADYGTLGEANVLTKEIKLRKDDFGGGDLPESGVVVTLLHEIVHVIDILMGYNLFIRDDGEDNPQIQGLTEGLYQVLKDNGLGYLFLNGEDVELDLSDGLDDEALEMIKTALEAQGLTIAPLERKKTKGGQNRAKRRG